MDPTPNQNMARRRNGFALPAPIGNAAQASSPSWGGSAPASVAGSRRSTAAGNLSSSSLSSSSSSFSSHNNPSVGVGAWAGDPTSPTRTSRLNNAWSPSLANSHAQVQSSYRNAYAVPLHNEYKKSLNSDENKNNNNNNNNNSRNPTAQIPTSSPFSSPPLSSSASSSSFQQQQQHPSASMASSPRNMLPSYAHPPVSPSMGTAYNHYSQDYHFRSTAPPTPAAATARSHRFLPQSPLGEHDFMLPSNAPSSPMERSTAATSGNNALMNSSSSSSNNRPSSSSEKNDLSSSSLSHSHSSPSVYHSSPSTSSLPRSYLITNSAGSLPSLNSPTITGSHYNAYPMASAVMSGQAGTRNNNNASSSYKATPEPLFMAGNASHLPTSPTGHSSSFPLHHAYHQQQQQLQQQYLHHQHQHYSNGGLDAEPPLDANGSSMVSSHTHSSSSSSSSSSMYPPSVSRQMYDAPHHTGDPNAPIHHHQQQQQQHSMMASAGRLPAHPRPTHQDQDRFSDQILSVVHAALPDDEWSQQHNSSRVAQSGTSPVGHGLQDGYIAPPGSLATPGQRRKLAYPSYPDHGSIHSNGTEALASPHLLEMDTTPGTVSGHTSGASSPISVLTNSAGQVPPVPPPPSVLSRSFSPASTMTVAPPVPAPPTSGYTDSEGHYIFLPAEKLGPNSEYQLHQQLGSGTFAVVVRSTHLPTGKQYAVKIVRAVARYGRAAESEIKLLRECGPNTPGVVRLIDSFSHNGHQCMVFPCYGANLYDWCKASSFRTWTSQAVSTVARQLVQAVSNLHNKGLVHTDLKPENIVWTKGVTPADAPRPGRALTMNQLPGSGAVVVIDLGNATHGNTTHTEVVSTRHYRAPEVILGLPWSYSADMWSVGCILVELASGKTLFQTHDNLEHLAMMERALGKKIPQSIISDTIKNSVSSSARKHFARTPSNSGTGSPRSSYYLNYSRSNPNVSSKSIGRTRAVSPLAQNSSLKDSDFLDFVASCLIWDPKKRLTAEEALRHPFLANALLPPTPRASLPIDEQARSHNTSSVTTSSSASSMSSSAPSLSDAASAYSVHGNGGGMYSYAGGN